MPPETLQTMPRSALSDTDERLLRKAIKAYKSMPIAEAAKTLLDGKSVDPTLLADAIGYLEHPKDMNRPEHLAAVILCRMLPPDSPEAERVSTILVDNYNRLSNQEAVGSCLTALFSLVAIFINGMTVMTNGSDYSPIYRVYLKTLAALNSPRSAGVAADLALTQPHARPTDLGMEALTLLPPLLERVVVCKPGELPETNAATLARLVKLKQATDQTKILALKAVEAIGNSATASAMQEYDRKEMSQALNLELDRVIGVLAARS